ncbi:unnamed protein product [Eruca vesicaria subsp. sativa]|uniref:Uncharacterized protein n=1 Tax=Eruca vesicaria subsp. sativa TaxID=29727 RepID=A0ABC8KN64_ERUVS|nr:unnamed protein product [Eruca vesicaria subsp. sativa]
MLVSLESAVNQIREEERELEKAKATTTELEEKGIGKSVAVLMTITMRCLVGADEATTRRIAMVARKYLIGKGLLGVGWQGCSCSLNMGGGLEWLRLDKRRYTQKLRMR